ncbi:hypothetical protein V6N11_077024 [Hibiscus sabdariffa]|uniref:non-specific serine/threonine protein kinase n=1 Tax=Hibiscus sabdariffa TaxID=183260 RepID=A0ABR2TCQ6_9ROSI
MFGFRVSLSSSFIYKNCSEARFECGNISIGYPFFGGDRLRECGHPDLELHCDGNTNTATIEMVGVKCRVMEIRPDRQTLRIARKDLLENGCCRPQTPIINSTIDSELFDLEPAPPGYINATLYYDCPSLISSLEYSTCNSSGYKNISVTMHNIDLDGCSASVTFPIFHTDDFCGNPDLFSFLKEAIERGFQVKWKEDAEAYRKCNASGGACGFDLLNNQRFCYCPHPNQNPNECPPQGMYISILSLT